MYLILKQTKHTIHKYNHAAWCSYFVQRHKPLQLILPINLKTLNLLMLSLIFHLLADQATCKVNSQTKLKGNTNMLM